MSFGINFKYRDSNAQNLDRDLETFKNGKFYAASILNLNDPLECLINPKDITREINRYFSLAEKRLYWLEKPIKSNRELTDEVWVNSMREATGVGVFSLSRTCVDTAMWSYYGGSHTGYCVGFDVDDILIYQHEILGCISVEYSSELPKLKHNNYFETLSQLNKKTAQLELFSGREENTILKKSFLNSLYGRKSIAWAHEKEIRLIMQSPGLYSPKINPIKEIYFGMNCDISLLKAVEDSFKHIDVKLYKMNRGKNYSIVPSRIR